MPAQSALNAFVRLAFNLSARYRTPRHRSDPALGMVVPKTNKVNKNSQLIPH